MADETLDTNSEIAPDADKPASDAKFTQADLDRITGEARKDAKRVASKSILEELGAKDLDEVKRLIQAKKEAEAAALTETERERAAREAAEVARDDALSTAKRIAVTSEVKYQAAQLGVSEKGIKALLAWNPSGFELDEAGEVKGVKEALKGLLEELGGKKQDPKGTIPDNGGKASNGRQLDSNEKESARKGFHNLVRTF